MLLIFLGVWNTWLMLIGFFLFVGAQLEDRSVVFQSVLESVRMEDVMLTGFSTLSPADTLEAALHKAVHTLQDDFPVVRGSDMVGVISKQRIVQALRVGGNGTCSRPWCVRLKLRNAPIPSPRLFASWVAAD